MNALLLKLSAELAAARANVDAGMRAVWRGQGSLPRRRPVATSLPLPLPLNLPPIRNPRSRFRTDLRSISPRSMKTAEFRITPSRQANTDSADGGKTPVPPSKSEGRPSKPEETRERPQEAPSKPQGAPSKPIDTSSGREGAPSKSEGRRSAREDTPSRFEDSPSGHEGTPSNREDGPSKVEDTPSNAQDTPSMSEGTPASLEDAPSPSEYTSASLGSDRPFISRLSPHRRSSYRHHSPRSVSIPRTDIVNCWNDHTKLTPNSPDHGHARPGRRSFLAL